MEKESLPLLLSCLLLLSAYAVTVSTLQFTIDDFPDGFAFGAGTAAYQYEGAAAEDGRSPSIWDTSAHSGKNPDDGNGDIASDGYHKYKDDVRLIKDIGLKAYRFSISWSRLIPNGRGAINPKGLQFYNNVINELVKEGIQIHAVIYHLDLPQILEDEYGGWLSPRIVDDFTAYADVCFREFGDRVAHWTTILEPNILAQGSYDVGISPPNHCSYPFGYDCTVGNSTVEPYLFLHNSLLAHSSAVRLYREKYQAAQKGVVGINLYSLCIYPLTELVEDIQATERANDFLFGCILHPFLFGDYPETMKRAAGSRLPSFSNYESELVTGAFDFIGLNHYSSIYAINNPAASKMPVRDQAADIGALFKETKDGPSAAQYLPGRMVDPQGLEHVFRYLREKYGNLSFYIQENGCTQADDSLMDVERIVFLKKYIASTLKAIRDGANVKGYSVWSFMDLYEIFGGYKQGWNHVTVPGVTGHRQKKNSVEISPYILCVHSLVQKLCTPVQPNLWLDDAFCQCLPHKLLFSTLLLENYICCYMYSEVVNPGHFRSSSAPGYKRHFGLVAVNFENRERRRQPRLSAHWYSDFLKNNAVIHVEYGTETAASHAQL